MDKPAGNLVLDDDKQYPGSTRDLPSAGPWTGRPKYGHKPVIHNGQWRQTKRVPPTSACSRARRSLLTWKVLGRRTDGWSNDDFPTETTPGDPQHACSSRASRCRTPRKTENPRPTSISPASADCRPPEAVAGTYQGPERQEDQGGAADRRGSAEPWCAGSTWAGPIDLDYNPTHPEKRGVTAGCGDDNRPTLTLNLPAGAPPPRDE